MRSVQGRIIRVNVADSARANALYDLPVIPPHLRPPSHVMLGAFVEGAHRPLAFGLTVGEDAARAVL